jgi:hypothetical protein
MEQNAAMISEFTRVLRLMLYALDNIPSPGIQPLRESTLVGLWGTYGIEHRPAHRNRILRICRQNRRFTWDDILAI